MDFYGWEFLSDDGHHRSGDEDLGLDPRDGVVDMDYFTCSPPLLFQAMEQDSAIKLQQQAPLSPDPDVHSSSEVVGPDPIEEIKNLQDAAANDISIATPGDLANAIYQAFSNKMEETAVFEHIKYSDSSEDLIISDEEEEEEAEDYIMDPMIKGKNSLNYCSRRLTGIGALRSIGVAAATLCMLLLTGHKRQKQICTDDQAKLTEQQVALREANSAVNGAPAITGARISFGGYFKASASRKSVLDDMLL